MMRFILFLLAAILIALALFSCARTPEPTERTVPDFTDAGVGNLITKSRYQLFSISDCQAETIDPMKYYISGAVTSYVAVDPETGWALGGTRAPKVEWNHFAGQAETWRATGDDVKKQFIDALKGFYTAVPPSMDASAGEFQVRGLNLYSETGYKSVTVRSEEHMTMEGRSYTLYLVELSTD